MFFCMECCRDIPQREQVLGAQRFESDRLRFPCTTACVVSAMLVVWDDGSTCFSTFGMESLLEQIAGPYSQPLAKPIPQGCRHKLEKGFGSVHLSHCMAARHLRLKVQAQ